MNATTSNSNKFNVSVVRSTSHFMKHRVMVERDDPMVAKLMTYGITGVLHAAGRQ